MLETFPSCTSDDDCITSGNDKCEGSVYETVQILFSQTITDDISKIEFIFEGLELPELTVDSSLGGVNDDSTPVNPDDPSLPFQAIMSGNTLTLDHLGDDGNQLSITPTRDHPHINELLINVPILFREDKFGFENIKVFKADGNEVPQSDHYMYRVYSKLSPFMAKYFDGISNLTVNEDSPQTWRPYCDDMVNITEDNCTGNWIYPYYPVLPKINKIGKFDEERLGLMGETEQLGEVGQIPFGSPNITWNEDDLYAPITSVTLPEQWVNYSLIDLDFSNIEDKVLSDIGPINNQGILIDDYKINFDGDGGIKLDKQKPMLRTKLGKNKKDKSY